MLFELGDEGIGRAPEHGHQFAATGVRRALGRLAVRAVAGPVVDGKAGDRRHVVACLLRHRAGAGEPFLHPPRAGIVGRGGKPEIAELAAHSLKNSADFGSAWTGSKGSSRPPFGAVPGMNCAMPWARWPLRVTGPTASGKAAFLPDHAGEDRSGRPLARAADSIIRHIASRVSVSRAWSAVFCATPCCNPGMASSSTLGLADLAADRAGRRILRDSPRHRQRQHHDRNANEQANRYRSHRGIRFPKQPCLTH